MVANKRKEDTVVLREAAQSSIFHLFEPSRSLETFSPQIPLTDFKNYCWEASVSKKGQAAQPFMHDHPPKSGLESTVLSLNGDACLDSSCETPGTSQ